MFATQTAHEGPVDLFKSLSRGPRLGSTGIQHAPQPAPATAGAVAKVAQAAAEAWADPDRQGTVIRGTRTREFTTRRTGALGDHDLGIPTPRHER